MKAPSAAQAEGAKRVALTADQLNRLAGKYALTADIVLTVTVENGSLFIRAEARNSRRKRERLPRRHLERRVQLQA